MGSVCGEHHHRHQNHHQGYKFHPLLSPTKKSLQDLNIPPRKLLSRRDSDYSDAAAAASLMHKFLPSNDSNNEDGFDPDDDDDPYSSDEFRMYEFKVRKCTRSRSHDWTDCPFSHPGEKARRRDPRRFHYSGTVCPEYRRSGGCSRGDDCEFAHGVFECWLHPARYRTEACKDGKSCKRKVCFFAHSPRELRVLPVEDEGEERDPCCHRSKQQQHQQQQQCCRYCCALSPTSTLLGLQNFSPPMSPSLSPPMSPMKAVGVGARGLSRYSDRAVACVSKGLTYEDMVIADLLGSFEGMNLTADPNSNGTTNNKGVSGSHQHGRGLWVDVTGYDNGVTDEYHRQQHQQQQMQFSNNNQSVFSTPSSRNNYFSPINNNNNNSDSCVSTGVNNNPNNNNGMVDESPDLGWVNDLLM